MRDFSEFNSNLNEINKRSGMKIFEKQLKSLEGTNITIDEVPYKGIILNHLNDMSDSKEERGLNISLDTIINQGSYVFYNNDYYLTVSDVDNHFYYKTVTLKRCNQILKWKDTNGIIHEYPCIISNDSYGSKQNLSNEYISENDSKMDIEVQENIYTKQIKRDTRFMFNNSEDDIFKSTDKTTSVTKGIITITSKKCLPENEDDFENNLAFNGISSATPTTPTTYSIVGLSDIPYMTTSTYSLSPTDTNVIFSVDDINICEIQSQSNGQCTLYAKIRDELVTLTAILNDVKVAEKVVTTSR